MVKQLHLLVKNMAAHDLRLSFGGLLINSGPTPKIIQELLEHAHLRMARRAYAVLLDTNWKKAVRKHLSSFGSDASNIAPLRSEKART